MHYSLAESTWGEEEINAMRRVIDSDRLTMGEEVKQFESAFAQKFGAPYAIMTSSGSSANLVGLASLFFKKENPLKPGDNLRRDYLARFLRFSQKFLHSSQLYFCVY